MLWKSRENIGEGESLIYAQVDKKYVCVHSEIARLAFPALYGNPKKIVCLPFGSWTIEKVLHFVYLRKVELEMHEIRAFLCACLFLDVQFGDVTWYSWEEGKSAAELLSDIGLQWPLNFGSFECGVYQPRTGNGAVVRFVKSRAQSQQQQQHQELQQPALQLNLGQQPAQEEDEYCKFDEFISERYRN